MTPTAFLLREFYRTVSFSKTLQPIRDPDKFRTIASYLGVQRREIWNMHHSQKRINAGALGRTRRYNLATHIVRCVWNYSQCLRLEPFINKTNDTHSLMASSFEIVVFWRSLKMFLLGSYKTQTINYTDPRGKRRLQRVLHVIFFAIWSMSRRTCSENIQNLN